MNLNISAEKFQFEYFILRMYFLKILGGNELTVHDRKFLYPLEDINAFSLSLTDGIDPDNQIRFSLKDRTIRKINEIAKRIHEKGIDNVEIEMSHLKSIMIQYLIRAFERMEINVKLNKCKPIKNEWSITESERILINELLKAKDGSSNIIINTARKLTNSGDIFTAESILEHGIKFFDSFEVDNSHFIGVVKNCLGKTLEAEHYYNLNKNIGDAIKLITSNYTISMLYLRHHNSNKINFEKGKDLLNEAFERIKSGAITHLDKEEQNFHEVFNRNGYGLVLFREGEIEEAIKLLKWGINTLSNESAKHFMHKSVILYNISQCYKKIGDYESAINCYRELLKIDPEFPEYHLELGLCMSEKGDNAEWEKCILKSLEVNPYHSDSHYFYSVLLANSENHELSEKHARLAWELSGDDITAYNLAYISSLNNKYDYLEILVPNCGSPNLVDWFILVAEKELGNSKQKAIELLKSASEIFPNNESILENLALVQSDKA